MPPKTVEMLSQKGLKLSNNEFRSFVKTVNQVMEGEISCKDISDSEDDKCFIKLTIYDGAFWRVGGFMTEEFIKSLKLVKLKK